MCRVPLCSLGAQFSIYISMRLLILIGALLASGLPTVVVIVYTGYLGSLGSHWLGSSSYRPGVVWFRWQRTTCFTWMPSACCTSPLIDTLSPLNFIIMRLICLLLWFRWLHCWLMVVVSVNFASVVRQPLLCPARCCLSGLYRAQTNNLPAHS